MNNLSELPFPTSISGYVTAKTKPEKFDDSGDEPQEWLSYRLACPCGNEQLEICAAGCRDVYLTPPISTVCSGCGKKNLLFDPKQHGYDALAAPQNTSDQSETDHQWECSECHSPGRIVVTFEYAIEEEFWDDFPGDETPQKENWFTWITVSHKCLESDAIQHAFDYECA